MMAKNRVRWTVLGEYCYATLMLMVYMYVWLQEKEKTIYQDSCI